MADSRSNGMCGFKWLRVFDSSTDEARPKQPANEAPTNVRQAPPRTCQSLIDILTTIFALKGVIDSGQRVQLVKHRQPGAKKWSL